VIAVDTNVLVYAHRKELDQHAAALRWLSYLAEGGEPWALPVFCLGEFVRVVTHPRLFDPLSTLDQAVEAVKGLLESLTVRLLSPTSRYPRFLFESLKAGDARGNLAFDAQIAALRLEHGALHLLTMDRDFSRFPRLELLSVDDPVPS
jgi:toxin-antitoxin system PIN domain toxin